MIRIRMADAIDKETGIIDVYKLLPNPGDSIMIVNCGDRFEIRHHSWTVDDEPPLLLTEQDIDLLTKGRIVWN